MKKPDVKKLSNALLILLVFAVSSQGCATVDLSQVYQRVEPSVVVIFAAGDEQRYANGKLVSNVSKSLGTGVVVSASGLILTASHVVQTADKLVVKMADNSSHEAQVLSTVVYADLALLKLKQPAKNLSYIEPGNSDNVRVGQQVFVIGAPYGIEHSLTAGYLSGRRLQKSWVEQVELLQTDAAVNQGNSGGPLFTSDGELIGIVSHIASRSGGNEGLGFAVSINMAKTLLLDAPAFWSGLEFLPIPQQLARAFNVPYGDGLLVQKVAKGSVANRLGLVAGKIPATIAGSDILIGGDIIIAIEGQNIYLTQKGVTALFDLLKKAKNKETISVTVVRNGEKKELSASIKAN